MGDDVMECPISKAEGGMIGSCDFCTCVCLRPSVTNFTTKIISREGDRICLPFTLYPSILPISISVMIFLDGEAEESYGSSREQGGKIGGKQIISSKTCRWQTIQGHFVLT